MDVSLTTDDRLIRAASRASGKLAIRVLNKERHQLLKGITIDEVVEQIRSRETSDEVKQ